MRSCIRRTGDPGASWRLIAADTGRVSIFLAIALAALLAIIAVSYDAAGQVRTLHSAQLMAAEAARAGGQALAPTGVGDDGQHQVEPEAAEQAIDAYLLAVGVEPAQRHIDIAADFTQVTVTVRTTYEPLLLGLFGYGEREVQGRGTTTPVSG